MKWMEWQNKTERKEKREDMSRPPSYVREQVKGLGHFKEIMFG